MPAVPTSTTTVETKYTQRLRSQSSNTFQKLTSFFANSSAKKSAPSTSDEASTRKEKPKGLKEKSQHSQSWPESGHNHKNDTTSARSREEGFSDQQARPYSRWHRSRTLDLGPTPSADHSTEPSATSARLLPSFHVDAPDGIGLKSQNLSINPSGEQEIDTFPLKTAFKPAGFLHGSKGKLLGKGASAHVHLMVRRQGLSNQLFAVKEFRSRGPNEFEGDYTRKVHSEYRIAASLHHPNLVTTVALCTSSSRGGCRWNHVMEYCPGGELFVLINKRYFTPLDASCLWKQLLHGVRYLHANGVAHRDIKPENLLLSASGCLKITDFGVADVFGGSGWGGGGGIGGGADGDGRSGKVRKCKPGICGSVPYMAPEVLARDREYDPRPLDVWSCAIVFFALRFYGSPWHAANAEHATYARFNKGWDEWLLSHPDGKIPDPSAVNAEDLPRCGPLFQALQKPALKRLLLKMMHPDPEKRISIENAVKTGFVRHIDCCVEEGDALPTQIDPEKSLKGLYEVKKEHCHLPPRD
ncbi:MAG: hypothetical protein Q9165_007277 [Trypethelium subeluteriae]